jgi:hypothetical protein
MYKMLITVLAASLGLAEWANVAAAELFSKTGPVIAIVSNDLFLGEAEGHLNRGRNNRYSFATESRRYLRGTVHFQR